MHVRSFPANSVVIAIDQKDSRATRDVLKALVDNFEKSFDEMPGERKDYEVAAFNDIRNRAYGLLTAITQGTQHEYL